MEEDILQEIQGNRPRSRTWPLPQPEEVDESKTHEEEASSKLEGAKKGSRKNAWGNLSYADLITQAITSSPDQRMTLSQIYTWMVENIPYFKDKGDSTSSAGWKNSIRHNLSLHNRFMRIQNEGNGKSSWWILNHDAKCEKTKRRNRSSSLDSDVGVPKIKTNKRGRKSTKRGEADERPQSPSSKCRGSIAPKSPTSGEPTVILEDSPFPFPMADYRHRSSSNTSTVSSIGRLSPIPSHEEEDSQDASHTMSPAQEHGKTTPTPMTDELIENMKENLNMTIGQAQGNRITPFRRTCSNGDSSNMTSVQQSMNIDSPSSFVDTRYQTTVNGYYPTANLKQTAFAHAKIPPQKSVYTTSEPGIVHRNGIYHVGNTVSSPTQYNIPERSVGQQTYNRPPPTYSQAMILNNCVVEPKAQQVMGRLSFQSNHCSSNIPLANDTLPMINVDMADSLPVDIDIDFLEGDIQCDVENVLRSELAFNDGSLDFNLDNYVPSIALPDIPLHGYVSGSMVH